MVGGAPTDLPLCTAIERTRHVRKTLGQHEIATVQTTAIDQAGEFVNLTTFWRIRRGNGWARLGRFVSLEEMARPKRMGAALTYARRYALFTLVGIAGEDISTRPT